MASQDEVLLNVIYLLLAIVFVVIPITSFIFKVWNSDYIKASTYSNAYALALTGLWSYDYFLKFPLPSVKDNLIIDHNILTFNKYGIKRYLILPTDVKINNFYQLTGDEFIFSKQVFEKKSVHIERYDINSICIDSNSKSLISFLSKFFVGNAIKFNRKDCDVYLFFDNKSNDIEFSLSNFYNVEITKAFNDLLYDKKSKVEMNANYGIKVGVKNIDFYKIKETMSKIFSAFLPKESEFLVQIPPFFSCDSGVLKFDLMIKGLEEASEIKGEANINATFLLPNSNENIIFCYDPYNHKKNCQPFKTEHIDHVELSFNIKDSYLEASFPLYAIFKGKKFLKYDIEFHLTSNGNEEIKRFTVYSDCVNHLFITNNGKKFIELFELDDFNAFVLDVSNEQFLKDCEKHYDARVCNDFSVLWKNKYFNYLSNTNKENKKYYNLYYVKYLSRFISDAQKYFYGNYVFFYDESANVKIIDPQLRVFIYPKKSKEIQNDFNSWVNELEK